MYTYDYSGLGRPFHTSRYAYNIRHIEAEYCRMACVPYVRYLSFIIGILYHVLARLRFVEARDCRPVWLKAYYGNNIELESH
jgi:hypothetical protein